MYKIDIGMFSLESEIDIGYLFNFQKSVSVSVKLQLIQGEWVYSLQSDQIPNQAIA